MHQQQTSPEATDLLEILRTRFHKHVNRHPNVIWDEIEKRLESNWDSHFKALKQMEDTGGEPDVVILDGVPCFVDCSRESPVGRRSLCYDMEGLASRKDYPPKHNAVDMASEMGVELLTEEEYQQLQELEEFDLKTSSWLKTPPNLRALGGALFGDRRYGRTFIYHNGAQSYYGVRGFRTSLKI